MEDFRLETIMASRDKRPLRRSKDEVAADLLEQAEAFKLLSATHILFHKHGKKFDSKFDLIPDISAIQTKIQEKIIQELGNEHCSALDKCAVQIDAFRDISSSSQAGEWERLTRMLDGKRVLRRLDIAYRLRGREDMRLHLAGLIQPRIDPEIKGYIEEFRQAARFIV